ncbi:3-deoxy-D-manno-octulosonic acid transferase [Roseivirga sp.]|uniref:3-deoxy-D-manno-octulosonic acid transferase n=1 Tax=Roseivirga sp. TaxID=1964215 RepID=UPI003B8E635A
MVFFYNLGTRFYYLLIKISSLFNAKAKLAIRGRNTVFEGLSAFRNSLKNDIVWFHAASLGEFEQGLPVMTAYKRDYPNHSILVTFFSPSGYEQRKTHPIADHVCYLPFDSNTNAQRFLSIVKPKRVFFIKYEYWYHYLKCINERQIQLFSLSALFTSNHVFFKWYGGLYRKMLTFFDHTFVQNESSLNLLSQIGITEVSISGDTRFDRVLKTIAKPNEYQEIQDFKGSALLCIVGSAWPSDMKVLLSFINDQENLKFIIAPHLIDEATVRKISQGLNARIHRYSNSKSIPADTNVLILDTMGMLSSVYQYGDFAYIGGAFGDGLHNILEAIAFGLPVVYGNKGLEKFPESIILEQLKGGFIIKDEEEAENAFKNLLDDAFRSETSDICREFVAKNAGATAHILEYLKANER